MQRESWQPILTESLADHAWQAIEAIAADPLMQPPADVERSNGDAALADGSAGRAMFFAYSSLSRDGETHADLAMAHLDAAVRALEHETLPPGLHDGFTGIAWAYAHLAGRLFDDEGPDALDAIDAALRAFLSRSPWDQDYDLIGGLVGYGVYALEQNTVSARALMAIVTAQLLSCAERRSGDATWFTPPGRLAASQLAHTPDGCYNLGVAHGVAGVIAWLGLSVCEDPSPERRELLTDAVAWLRRQQSADAASPFPHWIERGTPSGPSRLAWCYGDPGIAIAWLIAARGAERPDWERDALAVARRAAARPVESSGVVDAGLCHGAAGVAHIFNRLFQATHDDAFRETACQWFARALDMRPARVDDAGLLTGAAGIGLALLAACTDVEPEWDRALLLDVPAAQLRATSQSL